MILSKRFGSDWSDTSNERIGNITMKEKYRRRASRFLMHLARQPVTKSVKNCDSSKFYQDSSTYNQSRPTSASEQPPSSAILSPDPPSTKYTSSTKSQQSSSRPANKSCKNSNNLFQPTLTTCGTSSPKSTKTSNPPHPT